LALCLLRVHDFLVWRQHRPANGYVIRHKVHVPAAIAVGDTSRHWVFHLKMISVSQQVPTVA
jgi:hypothetical protein